MIPFAVTQSPVLNGAGMLGFSPDNSEALGLDFLGAFFTNPISAAPRTPARLPRVLEYYGGALMHTGYPNPGFQVVLKQYASRWEVSPMPIVPHLLVNEPEELQEMVVRLETIENICAIEIGLREDCTPERSARLTAAGLGELPLIVRLPLVTAPLIAQAVMDAGASLLSLASPRGALPYKGRLVNGRLYGQSVFVQSLEVVHTLTTMGVPVIASGGIQTLEQAQTLLNIGATAIQLDTIIWQSGLEQFRPLLENKIHA